MSPLKFLLKAVHSPNNVELSAISLTRLNFAIFEYNKARRFYAFHELKLNLCKLRKKREERKISECGRFQAAKAQLSLLPNNAMCRGWFGGFASKLWLRTGTLAFNILHFLKCKILDTNKCPVFFIKGLLWQFLTKIVTRKKDFFAYFKHKPPPPISSRN